MLGPPCPGVVDIPDSRDFRRSRDLSFSSFYEQESGQTILYVSPSGLHNLRRCPTHLLSYYSTRIQRQNHHCICEPQDAQRISSGWLHCHFCFNCLNQSPSDIPFQHFLKNNVHKSCRVTLVNRQDFVLHLRFHCGCLDTQLTLVKSLACPSSNHRCLRGIKTIPAISHPLTGCGQGNAITFTPASTQLLYNRIVLVLVIVFVVLAVIAVYSVHVVTIVALLPIFAVLDSDCLFATVQRGCFTNFDVTPEAGSSSRPK